MSLTIFNNNAAVTAQVNLGVSQRGLSANLAHLSSGLRINDASDDAAGLGISQSMRAQIRALGQSERNANDGISMMQVASGGMEQQANILVRMKELATQAANGTYATSDLTNINTEFQQLINELDRIASATKFNGVAMLSSGSSVTLQVGSTNGAADQIAVTFSKTDKTTLAVGALKTDTQGNAQAALTAIDTAIGTLSTAQATVGAAQNRLQAAYDNASSMRRNTIAAESRIRDVDVAMESAALARNQVLVQAGVSVLAQANQIPAAALTLLRG
jgi:flagellin